LLEELYKDDHSPRRVDQEGKKKVHGLRNRGLRESKIYRYEGIPGTSPIGGGLPYCASGTRVNLHQYPYGSCIIW